MSDERSEVDSLLVTLIVIVSAPTGRLQSLCGLSFILSAELEASFPLILGLGRYYDQPSDHFQVLGDISDMSMLLSAKSQKSFLLFSVRYLAWLILGEKPNLQRYRSYKGTSPLWT